MTNLIALMGHKGSGKSTLANLMWAKYYRKTSFATPIKKMIETLLIYQGTNYEYVDRLLNKDLKEESTIYLNNSTPRHAMQTLGTEWGRNLIHQNLWLDIWERSINIEHEKIIVDDLRFLSEAERIKNLGGKIIKIHRPNQIQDFDNHQSEREQIQIEPDLVIINDSTIEHMYKQLTNFLGENL